MQRLANPKGRLIGAGNLGVMLNKRIGIFKAAQMQYKEVTISKVLEDPIHTAILLQFLVSEHFQTFVSEDRTLA